MRRTLIMASLLMTTIAAHAPAQVVATYFHRTIRCQTCLSIESLARYVVNENMAADMEAGDLQWRVLNMEEAGNADLARELGLVGPSLVLAVRTPDGGLAQWRVLTRVWDLTDDPEAFDAYVAGELEAWLDKDSAGGEAGP